MTDEQILIKFLQTNDQKYVYALFEKYRTRLEAQTLKILSAYRIDLDINDFLLSMYQSVKESAEKYFEDKNIDKFGPHIFITNSFKTRNSIRAFNISRNLPLNNLIEYKEYIPDENISVDYDYPTKMHQNEVHENFISAVKNVSCGVKAKNALLLNYHGVNEKTIAKRMRTSPTTIHGQIKYLKVKIKKKCKFLHVNQNAIKNQKYN